MAGTRGRSLTQLEQELQSRGVKGFVIDASPTRITVLADRSDYERIKEMVDDQQAEVKPDSEVLSEIKYEISKVEDKNND
ncbi:hypothetical protein MUA90_10825 [Staphylococcus sp. IVB6181]|uniref:hypothetical protein n=1 Tax=Staphylococcus sp. IVB6181 TaxID=2929481 RepID=UPI0021D3D445|nr:hypothetical protein [Staphylococcus sp. IVB6181]UXV34507.1 hypothetical protein MUA90_10825 [Staphylococcus sp. IVB6181]